MLSIAKEVLLDVDIQRQLTSLRINEWLQKELFHFRWWFLLIIFCLFLFIWWKLLDKSKLFEISLYTVLITIIILVLDEIGEELTLWDYPTNIIPIFPPMSAIDLSCLPIVYSLIYQYFKTWKSFITATIIMSLTSCFILEPFFVWTGVYQVIKWKFYYGFPIYAVMAIGSKALINKIYAIKEKNKCK